MKPKRCLVVSFLMLALACCACALDSAAGPVPVEFPHTAVKDSSAFTVFVKLRIEGMQKGKPVAVLRQTTPKTSN